MYGVDRDTTPLRELYLRGSDVRVVQFAVMQEL